MVLTMVLKIGERNSDLIFTNSPRGTDSLGLKLYCDGLMNMTYLKNLIRN